MANLTEGEAEKLLEALVERGGVLKIITNEVKPELRVKKDDARSEAKAGTNMQDPAVMVLHDVVRVEKHPVRKTHWVAYSKEGDYVEAYDGPIFLLQRLVEWRYYDEANPMTTGAKAMAAVEAMHEATAVRSKA